VPCEGLGINREYDNPSPSVEEALRDDWRPRRPELTDTTCHVLRVDAGGRCIGFVSYFGCHPVTCCAAVRHIHGDYCGVATNTLERENAGAVGLFLQGAQGDVNTCVVHKNEQDSLRALDVLAERYARAVRAGLAAAKPVNVDRLACVRQTVTFRRKPWTREKLAAILAEQEAIVHAPGASDEDQKMRLAEVRVLALRQLIAELDAGRSLEPPTELHGMRIGPIALLGTPLEVFQAIKNEAVGWAKASVPVPLVTGLTNDSIGYAVDRTTAAKGGYAADMVPLMCRSLPFEDIHGQVVEALAALASALA